MSELNPKIKNLILTYEKVNIELAFAVVEESDLKELCDFCFKHHKQLELEVKELRMVIKSIRDVFKSMANNANEPRAFQLNKLLECVIDMKNEAMCIYLFTESNSCQLAYDFKLNNYKKLDYAS